jgi:hypothetical protein
LSFVFCLLSLTFTILHFPFILVFFHEFHSNRYSSKSHKRESIQTLTMHETIRMTFE